MFKLTIKFKPILRSYVVAIQSQNSMRCTVVHIPPLNTMKLNHLFLSIYKELGYENLNTHKHYKSLKSIRV